MLHFTKPLALIPLILFLSACGGGGGGGSSGPASTTSTPTNWSAQAYVKAANAEASDLFGFSVAISGDTMVVGATSEDSNQTIISNSSTASADNSASSAGAAYVFVRNTSNNTWSQQAYLKAPNADASNRFGTSVAISGDTVVVGAEGEESSQTTITNGSTASADDTATSAGAAYVFVRNTSDNTWSQQAYLKAPNADASDLFGASVSISADTIVVGADQENSAQTTITNGSTASANNSASGAGAAYVFVRNGSTWSQQAYLKASNSESGDSFGRSVAISGDTMVVAAQNEDSNQTTINNDGTASTDNTATSAGAVYVFVRTGSAWTQQAYLKSPNTRAVNLFGASVAISDHTIVVGADQEDSAQNTITNGATASADISAISAGAAYVFVRNGSTWSHQAYLKAPNAEAGDFFGGNVAVSGNSIVVGARFEDSNQTSLTNGSTASADNSAASSGATYVFTRN